jgi:hypothetical protein
MNNKGFATLAIVLIVAAILIAGGAWYYVKNISSPTRSAACTKEAKECPDGSHVGRTGPNCEFAACPTDKTCGSNLDCPTGQTCLVAGPIIAGQTTQKHCYPQGQAAPMLQ